MEQLQVRVIVESATEHVWMIVDHVWDSISAPIALSSIKYPTHAEAMLAGVAELRNIQARTARDHPLQD